MFTYHPGVLSPRPRSGERTGRSRTKPLFRKLPSKPGEPVIARICFIELPAVDLGSAKAFYASAFGWQLADFGPTYACTMTGDVDLGLQGDMAEAPAMPLAVIAVDDLEEAQAAVERAGGTLKKPIFAFPGGRRFHFVDPNGMELAVLQAD